MAILWFDILRIRRSIVLNNLSMAFPEQSTKWKVAAGRYSVMLQCLAVLEIFILPQLDDKWMKENVVFHGEENIKAALSEGKGVYGLSLHVRNGDLGANMVMAKGYPVSIITKFFKNKTLNDFWFYLRGPRGIKYIPPHGMKTPFEILKALKRNEIVIFVLDQYMGKPEGIETKFFGIPTGTAYGLALFYLRTHSPVVPIYSYEEKDHKIHIKFEKPLDLSGFITDDQERSIKDLTQYFTDVVEGIVRQHPKQWMWLHRRWKNFHD